MKKYLFLISLFFVFLQACKEDYKKSSKSEKFKIQVNIAGIKDSVKIILSKIELKHKYLIDTIYSSDGNFELKEFPNVEYKKYKIRIIDKYTRKEVSSFFFWSKNENIKISGTLNAQYIHDIKITGNKINDIMLQYDSILWKYDKDVIEKINEEKDTEKHQFIYEYFLNKIKLEQLNYLFTNSNNEFSLTELISFKNRYLIGNDSINLFYSTLNKYLKNSEKGKYLKQITQINKYKIGDKVQNFHGIDVYGKEINLFDFKGKVVLLDFWASWCVPCHKQNQDEFNYLFDKYRDKGLVIISYSLDEQSKLEKWIISSKNDNIRWINISNLNGFNDILAYKFSVVSIPHSYLISKKGIILKSFVGYKKGSNVIEKEILKLF